MVEYKSWRVGEEGISLKNRTEQKNRRMNFERRGISVSLWLTLLCLAQVIAVNGMVDYLALGAMLNVSMVQETRESVVVHPDDYKAHFLK